MKRSKLILVLAAAALVALVYIFALRREKPLAVPAGSVKPSSSFKPEEIVEMSVTRQGQAVRLENREGKWVIVEPVDTPADQSTVSSIAEVLADSRQGKPLAAAPDDIRGYGLEQPSASLEIRLRGGETRRVLFGSADSSGYRVYARFDDSKDVVSLPLMLLAFSDTLVLGLRDRTLLDIPQHEVMSLALSNEHGRFELTHEDSSWALESPAAGAADSVVAESLLNEADSTQVEEFVRETADDLAVYGLDRPRVTLSLRPQAGGEVSLMLGARDGDSVYARRSDRPQILKVRSSLYDALNVELAKLYDRNIVRFDADGLVRVRISYGRRTLVAEKGHGGDWVVKEPDFGEGEGPDITRILNVLKTTRADEVMDRPPAQVVSKLARPEAEVRLTDRGGGVQTLWVSAADGEQAYARREGSPLVYKISKYLLRDLSFE
jgi:hypothetical protein